MNNFNKIGSESDDLIKNFAVLSSGAIIKFFESSLSVGGNRMIFESGRVITEAVPNGLAFKVLKVKAPQVIAEGELLHPEENVRELEEEATDADRQA